MFSKVMKMGENVLKIQIPNNIYNPLIWKYFITERTQKYKLEI